MKKEQIQAMLDGKWLINDAGQRCYYDDSKEYPFRFVAYGCESNQSEEIIGAWESSDWEIIDAPKKEPQFKPFDRVLVRDDDGEIWCCGIFSHYHDGDVYPYICASSAYRNCIRYEGNEHLIGTTEAPK